jgi:ABC transporter substrate binding protein
MIRRAVALVLFLGLLAAPLSAAAQSVGTVYRIGYLTIGSPSTAGSSSGSARPLRQVFEQALHERGWVTGKNVVIAYRYAEGKADRLPALAAELVRLEPQVIVAVPTASARAAKDATGTIPIVMWGVPDPIGERLIASFARPGGNVTGVTGVPPWESLGKQRQRGTSSGHSMRRSGAPAQRAALQHSRGGVSS